MDSTNIITDFLDKNKKIIFKARYTISVASFMIGIFAVYKLFSEGGTIIFITIYFLSMMLTFSTLDSNLYHQKYNNIERILSENGYEISLGENGHVKMIDTSDNSKYDYYKEIETSNEHQIDENVEVREPYRDK